MMTDGLLSPNISAFARKNGRSYFFDKLFAIKTSITCQREHEAKVDEAVRSIPSFG